VIDDGNGAAGLMASLELKDIGGRKGREKKSFGVISRRFAV
jgi:hypothetical protein